MTPTPRTDAVYGPEHPDEGPGASLCRTLERENDTLVDENVEANGRLDMQMKEIAALRADKARLDWLESVGKGSLSPLWAQDWIHIRSAIDAARQTTS